MKIKLNNGLDIPQMGLGVYQSRDGAETRNAVKWALEAGYRHIDTAMIYRNEGSVGEGIRESGVEREGIFVTTKLWNSDHGYDSTLRACEASLKRLGMEYVDLYLVHWPLERKRLDTWRAMETLVGEGKCRSIGISNYMVRHMEEVLEHGKIVPAVNQFELSPYNYLRRVPEIAFCEAHGIVVESYSPLTKGEKLGDAVLVGMAKRYGKTPAQILIRWVVQRGYVVIPKSTRKERIIENAAVFDFVLTDEDMRTLDGLNENLVTGWDPTDAP